MCKVIEQWQVCHNLLALYLDGEIPHYKPYRNYRIEGAIYEPVSMSRTNGKCIAIKAEGNFVGKEVEFI